MWPQFRWPSKLLCFFGRHHWFRSTTLQADLTCVVCGKDTPAMAEYRRLVKDRIEDGP
jgi:hypothetical protein